MKLDHSYLPPRVENHHLRHIHLILNVILEVLLKMSAQDDQLTAAVQKLSDDIDANQTELEAIITQLQSSPVASDPAVDAAITKLAALSTNLEATTTSFSTATAPTPDPTTPAAS